jgi:hydroxycarboxylate dehydrogenase B
MPSIQHESLRAAIRAIVAAAGSEEAEARAVADNLVEANLTGHDSHGVGMIPRYVASVLSGALRPNRHAELVPDHGTMLLVDGGAGYGQVIGAAAMDLGIERARAHGVCVVATRNSFHLCRIGAWGERCAAAGMVSTHHVNVVGHHAYVAPWRGSDARYVTNPYCAVMPGTLSRPPVLLDFATSRIAQGKVRVARNKGELAPEGALIDSEGRPTRDPEVLFQDPQGALLPFGEHKGYGLALMNELFAAVLTGGQGCRPETEREPAALINNMVSTIIDPGRLVDPAFYERELDATLDFVTGSPPANPAEPVLVPGDPERATRAERAATGVPVDTETWREIRDAGASVGLAAAEIDRLAGLA